MYIADFHIHSKYARATSTQCVPEHLAFWACRKGLQLIGTGDFTHPAWRAELREKLIPTEEGLYALREELRLPDACLGSAEAAPRFIVSGEISSIYKKNGKVRKVHNVVLLPSLEDAERLSRRLEQIGNLHSDGRPILGLDSRDLLEITLEACPQALFIPAHIWTPHFSLFGAYSGFDDITECFEDLTGHIFALETGLSSDPPMNWRLSALDPYTLISNSDAHSPANLAREANLFNAPLSYPGVAEALRDRNGTGFAGTLEFFPEEGKYHCDGHRPCKVCLTPAQTRAAEGVCPACGGRITVGVLHRVEVLADRPEGFVPPNARAYERLIPLREILASALGHTIAHKRVAHTYETLLGTLGPELHILRQAPLEDVEREAGPLVAEGIRRLRAGQVALQPGYDGEYGRVSVLTSQERALYSGQLSLLPAVERPAKRKEAEAPSAKPVRTQPQAAAAPKLELNAAQREAVAAPEPAVAVIAGPGAGKTRTLVERVAHLVGERGARPEQITAVTFTNKAAGEMRARLETHFGDPGLTRKLNIGTFHALCLKLLKAAGNLPGLLPETEALALVADLAQQLRLPQSPRTLLHALSLFKSTGEMPGGLPQALIDAYEAQLAAYGAMDYDDVLLRVLALFEGADRPEPAFTHLLVDEFQDINPVQYRLIHAWSQASESLFVIGDPNQAIYGFRGSDSQCFERLFSDFPQARRIVLDRNYRSTPEVLRCACSALPKGAASALEPMRAEGAPVRVWEASDDFSQALFVAREISRQVGGIDMIDAHGAGRRGKQPGGKLSFSDMAVLYRNNRQADALEQCFRREGIPYVVAGRGEYLSDPHVRSCLAFFRLLHQPEDLLSLRACLRDVGQFPSAPAQEILARYRLVPPSLDALRDLLPQAEAPASLDRPPLSALVDKYAPLLSAQRPDQLIQAWMADLGLSGAQGMGLLQDTAVMYDRMESLLHSLALGKDADVLRSGGRRYAVDAVRLLTLHGAKGLEFPLVFLCGLNEGVLPARSGQAEEERRLLYVGMTRAQDELHLLISGKASPFVGDLDVRTYERSKAFADSGPSAAQLSIWEI